MRPDVSSLAVGWTFCTLWALPPSLGWVAVIAAFLWPSVSCLGALESSVL